MAAQDLTTLAVVREALQKQAADTGQDAIITSLITRASDAIMRYLDRAIKPALTAEAKIYEYDGRGLLDLAPYDLASLDGIEIDTDTASPYTLTSDQYQLTPKPAVNGVYTRIRINVPPGVTWRNREVTVTGDWGWATIPEDIVEACVITVITWLRRDVEAHSSMYKLEEGVLERPEAIPSAARAMLSPYKRMSY